VNSNDSNNNNDTNDNKNSNSSGNPLLPDEKDPTNDNSITDECKSSSEALKGSIEHNLISFILLVVLNSDDLSASGSGNNSNSNKLGMHIKSEDPATDPLAGVDSSLNNSNFGSMSQGNNPSGPNRSGIPQNSPDRIQPLPSNVVNKQSNSMDVSIKLGVRIKSVNDLMLTLSVHATAKSDFCLLNATRQQRCRGGSERTVSNYHCVSLCTARDKKVSPGRFATIPYQSMGL
jgi:hypothetical protein